MLRPSVQLGLCLFCVNLSATTLEEVRVYAQKKPQSENVQQVPVAVTVFDKTQLDSIHFSTLEDINFLSPNTTLDSAGTFTGSQNFSIRGLGVNSTIPSLDPAVGIFVDGVYLGTTYGGVLDSIDTESIEIVRGPQGVLFGRNTTGGAILIRSKRPTGERALTSGMGIESGPQYTASVSAETPIYKDALFGKLNLYYRNDDGYFNNSNTRDVGKEESFVIRPSLYYTGNFDSYIKYEHGELNGDGAVAHDLTSNETDESNIDNLGDTDITWDNVTVDSSIPLWNGTITNIFGWRQLDQDGLTDVDGVALPLFNGGVRLRQDQISNELRYSGQLTGKWQITTGLYYFTQDIDYQETRSLIFGTVFLSGGGRQDHKTYALFANNEYQLSDELTLTAGLRYTHERKSVDITRLTPCNITTTQCPVDFSDSNSWSNLAPKLGFTWAINDQVMLYAHWSKGFRSGGYNLRTTNPQVFSPGPTDEEDQDAFEMGIKSVWLNDRIKMNITGFLYELDDMQREIVIIDPVFGVVQGTENTADARIYGFEIDSRLLLDNFTLDMSAGLIESDYKNVRFDISGDGIINGVDEDLSIPRIPKWTCSIGATYGKEIAGIGTLKVHMNYSYRDDSAFTDDNAVLLPSYHVLNADISLNFSKRWKVSAYAKNLTDEAIIRAEVPLPFAAFAASSFTPIQKGRRFGVSVAYTY